ncbi:MAG: zinc-dependent metalloprotease [Propioniciclava sp.]
MADLPWIDADAAMLVGRTVLPGGPPITRRAAERVVAGLRRAAGRSEQYVEEVTQLGVQAAGPVRIVDRLTWLGLNIDMTQQLLARVGTVAEPRGLPQRLGSRWHGAQLGGALAILGARILGQWLPFLAMPQLVLVAPNIAVTETALRVRPTDFRLWVCLHEQTHRMQFARAPWLADHLLVELSQLLDEGPRRPLADRARPGGRGPWRLMDTVLTRDQQVVFDRVSAVMSLLEGYAEDMMDRVGPQVIPTVATIRSRFDARRNQGGLGAMVSRALGSDLKLAQYREGARFCRAVVGRVGVPGLNAVYEGPDHFPTPAELADPDVWVRRIHG